MTALLPRTEAPDFRITGAAVDDELVVTLAGEVDLSSRERISQFAEANSMCRWFRFLAIPR